MSDNDNDHSELLNAAIKVLAHTQYNDKHFRLKVGDYPFNQNIEGELNPARYFLHALAALSAAVDAQIEADTARDIEQENQREYLERLQLQWQGVPVDSEKWLAIKEIMRMTGEPPAPKVDARFASEGDSEGD